MSESTAAASAASITWTLDDLYPDIPSLKSGLNQCSARAQTFEERYRGRLSDLSASELAEALRELGDIQDLAGRAFTYAYLDWSTDTLDSNRGALLQEVRERYTAISTHLIFFDLEWAALGDDLAANLLQEDEMHPYRHYLEVQRIMKPHLLSEPEEKILVEKDVTGRSAWNRFFDEMLGEMCFKLDGETQTQQQILSKLHDIDRDVRRNAARAFTAGLSEHVRSLAYIFNTILADKATNDRLRGFPSWITSRNLSNEVQDATVASLIESVTEGYPVVKKFYEIKKRVLGLETMYDYDRYAPVGESEREVDWTTARETVLSSYASFHPRMGEIAGMFFENNWIDARLAPGKRGGAFSHGAVPSVHPYILMNYTGRIRDVQTLAHEMGHGVHQYLSRDQGIFHADTPLTTAETASVFGEMLVFQELLSVEEDPRNRLAMLMGKIDDSVATVFRQVAMNRFENRIHLQRRESGELSVEDFSAAWIETQKEMFQGSVTLTDDYHVWWSYIPHFLHTPGYVYAYAFGELLVVSLYEKYRVEGAEFTGKYMELLSSGGSDWPHVLVSRLGIDLQDRDFWRSGIRLLERMVEDAEKLANQILADSRH